MNANATYKEHTPMIRIRRIHGRYVVQAVDGATVIDVQDFAEVETAKAAARDAVAQGIEVCEGGQYPCKGGTVYISGRVENGVFKGTTGTCYRCRGKGWQTSDDRARNWGYDNFYRRIPS